MKDELVPHEWNKPAKWRCPICHIWTREPMGKQCAACLLKMPASDRWPDGAPT